MRILVIILGAFLCLPALGQKKRVNDAIYVGQGIEINLHPYPYLQHKFPGTAPKDALECDPGDQRYACGKARWNSTQLPLDVRYTTTVPAVIRMDGPMDDVIFNPFVRCIITDKEGRRMSADVPGISCRTILEQDGDYMRWAFGGRMFPEEGLKPGTYTGLIPVTVHDEEDKYKWEFTMPVAFTMAEAVPRCTLKPQGDQILDFPEINFTDTPDGTPGSPTFTRTWDVQVLAGFGEGDVKDLDPHFARIVYNGVRVVDGGRIPGFDAKTIDSDPTKIRLEYTIPYTGFDEQIGQISNENRVGPAIIKVTVACGCGDGGWPDC